mmetsp:Transcript_19812/g.25671  ORF Transcript_19812/g.25671 Transcript_19812/m.25671 type:complete len:242 (-) Transcript_19812:453-1178(-)
MSRSSCKTRATVCIGFVLLVSSVYISGNAETIVSENSPSQSHKLFETVSNSTCKMSKNENQGDLRDSAQTVSVTTFNILCPKYLRTSGASRELGRNEALLPEQPWKERNAFIARLLSEYNSDIFCLQEFWLSTERQNGVLNIFEEALGDEYELLHHKRTGKKEDGLVIGYKKSLFSLVTTKKIEFPGFFHYNRVGLIAHLKTKSFIGGKQRDLVIGNIHVFFPDNFLELRTRNQQVGSIFM